MGHVQLFVSLEKYSYFIIQKRQKAMLVTVTASSLSTSAAPSEETSAAVGSAAMSSMVQRKRWCIVHTPSDVVLFFVQGRRAAREPGG